MKMKKIIFCLIVLLLPIKSYTGNNPEILKAMKDEMARSMAQLKMEGLGTPYFIEYTLKITRTSSIKANLGNIHNFSDQEPSAVLNVAVRVGNYKFDNTNFSSGGIFFFGGGGGDDEERFSGRRISPEADYQVLRRELWLATDAAYKDAAETFANKEALVKSKIKKDTTWDFIKYPPKKSVFINTIENFDKERFIALSKELSAIFKEYKEINTSNVSFEFIPEETYYLNNEGMEYYYSSQIAGLEVSAATQANDGMILTNFYSCYANNLNQFPSNDSLFKAVRHTATILSNAKKASSLDESYSGPVIFTEQAAAELFAQVFAPNLSTKREQMSSSGFPMNDATRAFQNKIGGRVLPDFISVIDKPALSEYLATPLIGKMEIDQEGVIPQEVSLVKNGYLKTLLSSRVPIKRIKETNGHKINGGTSYTNLFVEVGKGKTANYNDLKKKMMSLCKDRDLPYGIIVKRVMNSNINQTSIVEQIYMGDFSYMSGGDKINLCEVYKVYPDGKEELLRGIEGAGFTPQSFKDIILTGKKNNVYNFWSSASGYGNWYGASIVIPDLLFEDAEIRVIDKDFKKPPFLTNPISID